jgi:Raf kinase inhibitor-like YbhB/YbcL family protein
MKKVLIGSMVCLLMFAVNATAGGFTLQSSDLGGQLTTNQVFNGFGCSGKNISPALNWINPPKGTKSFAVTVYDPDAPTGSGFWHWVIFDIPEKTHALVADSGNIEKKLSPAGSIQSVTSYGKPGFGGACPPEGDTPHRYVFTVYALDIAKLGLNAESQPALVGFFLNQHALSKASIISYYGR